MDRENLRELRAIAPRRRGRGEGAAAARVRPRQRRRARPRRARPVLRRPRRLRDVLDQVEAACRGLLDAAVDAATLDAPPTGRTVRALERVGGGDINDAYKVQFDDESFGFVKTRAGRRARASTPPRPPACAGSPSRAACACREVLGVGDDVLVLDWVDEGGRGDAGGVRRGPGDDPRGGRRRVRRRRRAAVRSARAGAAQRPARPTGRRSTPSGGCAAAAARGAVARRRAGRSSACASGSPSSPGRPSRRRGCTATCGAATCCGGATGAPWLIDPAAYGGHREVDLAMLQLFGAPGRALLRRLRGAVPARPGHEERVQLYQLFPLLVHAALFGGGYAASAERAARATSESARDQRGVAAAEREQLLVGAALGDLALVEDDDLVGVADRREAVGDDDRRAALGELLQRLADGALGRPRPAPTSPRRARAPAGCAGSCGRSRSAASRRRRSGSRARRRRCRSRRAAPRSCRGSAPRGRRPRSRRRSPPGVAKRRFSRTDAWNR